MNDEQAEIEANPAVYNWLLLKGNEIVAERKMLGKKHLPQTNKTGYHLSTSKHIHHQKEAVS